MADRDLRVTDFIKLYEAHGCKVKVTRAQKVHVSRIHQGEHLSFWQHAHKGLKDKFRRGVVRVSRRKLSFDKMDDSEFYRPLD